jgi:TorA maturation chaperone TorD
MQWLLQAESALAPAQRWQYRFFERHLAPWYAPALADMKAASHTPFHAALAETALAFLDLEALTGAAGPPAH